MTTLVPDTFIACFFIGFLTWFLLFDFFNGRWQDKSSQELKGLEKNTQEFQLHCLHSSWFGSSPNRLLPRDLQSHDTNHNFFYKCLETGHWVAHFQLQKGHTSRGQPMMTNFPRSLTKLHFHPRIIVSKRPPSSKTSVLKRLIAIIRMPEWEFCNQQGCRFSNSKCRHCSSFGRETM